MTEADFIKFKKKHFKEFRSARIKDFSYQDLLHVREKMIEMLTDKDPWSIQYIRAQLGVYEGKKADLIMTCLLNFNDLKAYYKRAVKYAKRPRGHIIAM